MQKILNAALRVAAIAALASLAVLFIEASMQVHRIGFDLHQLVAGLNNLQKLLPEQVLNEVDKQATGIRQDANKQLNATRADLNRQLTRLSSDLNLQVTQAREQLLAQTAEVTNDTAVLMDSTNQILTDKDIPGLIRDSRFAMARTARTMGHVEQMSDAIAKDTPKTSAAVAGIAQDVHKVTTDITAPRPWWKKVLSVMGDSAKVAGAIF